MACSCRQFRDVIMNNLFKNIYENRNVMVLEFL